MSMIVAKEFRFEASHILPKHPGKCSRLHGHSWMLRVAAEGPVDSVTGFVIDYAELKRIVQPIVDRFDHQHLNAYVRYPSSENIAIHIAHELRDKIQCDRLIIAVAETEGTQCEWDSSDDYCQKIFIADSLDSKLGAMDAGWRSPAFAKPSGTQNDRHGMLAAMTDDAVAKYAGHEFEDWSVANTELAQRKLYKESLGKPGAIFDELKQFTDNEKVKEG